VFLALYLLDSFGCEEFILLFMIPVCCYKNIEKEKLRIYKENKGKSGIYQFTNKINGKIYIGSSSDLGRRFLEYFRPSVLSRGMVIYKAIIKYGIYNFDYDIIKYTELDNIETVEQFYIDTLKPEYNLSPTAGSNLGYK